MGSVDWAIILATDVVLNVIDGRRRLRQRWRAILPFVLSAHWAMWKYGR